MEALNPPNGDRCGHAPAPAPKTTLRFTTARNSRLSSLAGLALSLLITPAVFAGTPGGGSAPWSAALGNLANSISGEASMAIALITVAFGLWQFAKSEGEFGGTTLGKWTIVVCALLNIPGLLGFFGAGGAILP